MRVNPFGTDDNILRLINVVRTGIIRPPTHAGPLEPLLLRLLQVSTATRPDAATARDLLTQFATRLTEPGRQKHPDPDRDGGRFADASQSPSVPSSRSPQPA